MTLQQRNAEIAKLLKAQTKRNTVSKAAARQSLIKEGIYTSNGRISPEYGGGSKKAKVSV